jgi:hypothetical protein
MTLRPQALPSVPDATAAAGQTAFPKSSRAVSTNRLYGFEQFNLQKLISFSSTWRVECPLHVRDLGRLP